MAESAEQEPKIASKLHLKFVLNGPIKSMSDLREFEIEAFQIDEITDSKGKVTTRQIVPEHTFCSSTSSTSSCCA